MNDRSKMSLGGLGLALILLSGALSGCAKPRSVVGNWNIPLKGVEDAVATFGANGDLKIVARVGGQPIEATGTYTVADSTLTMTPEKFDLKDLPVFAKLAIEPELKKLKGPVAMKLGWTDDQTLQLSPMDPSLQNLLNQELTLKRIETP